MLMKQLSGTSNPAYPAKGISITFALIANIAFLTLAIGGLCVWLITHWGSQDIHDRVNQRLTDTATSIASRMSQDMDERYLDVRSARDLFERELAGASLQQKREVLERVRDSHHHFSWLGVVTIDGKIRVGTGKLLEGLTITGRNWFEEALREPVFFGNLHPAKLLEPHLKNEDGAPLYVLDIALPLHSANGQVNGVVGSHLNWRMMEDAVKETLQKLSNGVPLSASIIAPDGTIIYDTQKVEGNIAELMKPLLAGQMLETKWPGDQEATYMAMVSVPQSHIFNGLGWHVVVRESASAVNAGIVRMNWRVVGVSVLTGLVFSILGLFAVRQITRPLQILANDITKFGETETPPQSGSSTQIAEVKNIHSAFRDMAANVLIHQKLLSETQVEIVKALGRAGEFRDNETGNHVFRMSICSARLAELAGMKPQDVEVLRLASQMHDIGKIGIPDHVLLKPGKFDDAERAIMERHCEIGAGILTGLDSPLIVMARSIALSHHEKWDGSGYPHRLAGNAIPLEGRVAAICDVFDALLSSRPYKQGWPLEKVLAFMREQSGRHFDPALIALFLQHIDDFTQIRSQFVDEPVLEEMTVSSN